MNPLQQLEACGQSPWLDYLKRSLIEKGELRTLIERDGLKGVTSNPSIFEKAIGESDEYTQALKQFQAQADHSVSAIYEHLAIADIRAAADVLRPVYERTQGRDGYISLECSPYLANDTKATVNEALRLWAAVERPNLMVKVPATPAGIPAIRQLIGRGLNINITLLFSVSVYEQVVEAYISGLEDLARAGGDVSKIGSVASIFVSRIDTAVDKRLDKLGDKQVADRLRGKVAIANAKLAYARYKALFSGPRWQRLAAAGAKTQRLLWASTSIKNPAYKDTMYVEALIGRDTVDTIPPATMDAFRDHGKATPDVIEQDVEGARALLAELEQHGISLKEVTDELVTEGVQQFADAFDKLLGAVAQRRRILLDGDRPGLEVRPGSAEMKTAFAEEMEAWRRDGRIRRLWAGDTSLWTGTDEDKWLGWLHVVEQELADFGRLNRFAEDVKQGGFSDVVLLGMGGSSLGPEVLGETFGRQAGWPRFHMLDSTDPAQIRTIERAIDLGKTLFIVSSKSGGTLEPNIFMDYFLDRVGAVRGKERAGEHFVAVTDPGSSLGAARQAAGLRSYLPWRALDRRALLRAVEVRPGAGGGDRPRRQPPPRNDAADGASLRSRRAPRGEPGRAARRRHGRRGNALRARQGDDHCLAGDRRSRRLAGAASGGEHRQARARADPLGRRAAHHARSLRQRPLLRLPGAGRAARSIAAPGSGSAGAGRPSGRADQREGYLAHRPGILPLGDRHRGRRRDHRHRPLQPAGCRGEQRQDAAR